MQRMSLASPEDVNIVDIGRCSELFYSWTAPMGFIACHGDDLMSFCVKLGCRTGSLIPIAALMMKHLACLSFSGNVLLRSNSVPGLARPTRRVFSFILLPLILFFKRFLELRMCLQSLGFAKTGQSRLKELFLLAGWLNLLARLKRRRGRKLLSLR